MKNEHLPEAFSNFSPIFMQIDKGFPEGKPSVTVLIIQFDISTKKGLILKQGALTQTYKNMTLNIYNNKEIEIHCQNYENI